MTTISNAEGKPASVIDVVTDPQFISGYKSRLANCAPEKLYLDNGCDGDKDTWGYDRGRMVAAWLLMRGYKPPHPSNAIDLARAYNEARKDGAVL